MFQIILLSVGVYCVAAFLLGSLVGRCISTSELEEYEQKVAHEAYFSRFQAEAARRANIFFDENQPMPSTEDLLALAAVNSGGVPEPVHHA
jgi:hypothetical protein